MRASLASSIAVTCAAVLALPVSLVAPAAAEVPSALGLPPAATAQPPAPELPGATQSLPLEPLSAADRSWGGTDDSAAQGLARRDVRPFSLVGVVWDDPTAVLHGTVQVRTRAADGGAWSEWQDIETHNEEHGADPDTAEGSGRALKGSTAPLWVGDSDGVEIRVRGEETLPEGLRLELVDPGEAPPTPDGALETAPETTPGETPESAPDGSVETAPESAPDGSAETAPESAPDGSAETAPETSPEAVPDTAPEAVPETSPDGSAESLPDEAPETDPDAVLEPVSRRTPLEGATRPESPGAAPAALTRAAASPPAPGASLVPTGSFGPFGSFGALGLLGLSAAEAAAGGVNAQLAPYGAAWIPALSKAATELTLPYLPRTQEAQPPAAAQAAPAAPAAAKPYIGPQPKIITRKGWGADESIREKGFVYTKSIKAAFVHHSVTGNNYTCAQAPSVLRSIYRYHVKSSGWRDFGYNFAVDKCGNIYEGRAGGVAKPVLGAHTLGFNTNSMGIAVLGTFTKNDPPAAAVTAVAKLTAWKLGLHGVNPKGTATLVSGGGNLYAKGKNVRFNAIAGHRDGFATECPGARLYGKLGTARTSSAKYQGRS
ncbi:N-acetylmuramoyl-L-alanine amidase [Streptomyces sp. NPDC002057]|uniref:N-acetylmuramoyl-L-alanine amidase n=1 Tax=Streptomyces sp. NPDC002057 TaxID=3154664 RepID=UPI003316CEF9